MEKTNHEATPKHQGNLKRFLRDLHRGHEKEQKDKDRAKAEVARLNGVVSGEGSSSVSVAGPSGTKDGAYTRAPVHKPQATAVQRKQQLAQLVEMGVAIPDEFRPDMAMAGEWQVTTETIIEEDGDKKPDALALGVRKRPITDEEEEAQEAKKRRWGSAYKSHPEEEEANGDLDVLLGNVIRKGKEVAQGNIEGETISKVESEPKMKEEPSDVPALMLPPEELEEASTVDGVKIEQPDIGLGIAQGEEISSTSSVMFKKRKAKNIRQK